MLSCLDGPTVCVRVNKEFKEFANCERVPWSVQYSPQPRPCGAGNKQARKDFKDGSQTPCALYESARLAKLALNRLMAKKIVRKLQNQYDVRVPKECKEFACVREVS